MLKERLVMAATLKNNFILTVITFVSIELALIAYWASSKALTAFQTINILSALKSFRMKMSRRTNS